jgi:hypothetical protein
MNTAGSEQTPGQLSSNIPNMEADVTPRPRKVRPFAFIAGFAAAIVLTGGGAAAYAANGGSLLIGRSNVGSATTTLSNSGGTALKLNAKSGTAPLAVNRTNKVVNLNADFLDGRSDASYALAGGKTGVILAHGEWIDVDETTPGNDALLAVADCPVGTQLTGGGVDNLTGYPTAFNGPDGAGTWYASSFADPGIDVAEDLTAYAVCYNPRGSVPGALTPADARSASGSTAVDRLARMLARR